MEVPGSIPGTPTIDNMKKILITTSFFYPYISGLSLYPFRLGKLFAKQGHQVSALTFQHDAKLMTQETINGVSITRIKLHFRISKGLINFFYPLVAWQKVSQNDIVIINCPGVENFWVSLWAKLMRKPTVVLYHCDLSFDNNWFLRLASSVANLSSFISCFLSDRIVNSSRNYAQTSPILKPFLTKVRYHYPLIEQESADKFYLQQLKTTYQQSQPIIGFVGRISREKNLETLIQALSQLRQKYPKLLFVCVGPFASQVAGEKAYYRKIQSLLEELKLNYAVLGILDQSQLTAFFRFINVLVLPSNNRTEAFVMVQIEAMLQGTPVVASQAPGIEEAIGLTKMGELFAPNNPTDLTKKLLKVLKNQKKYQAGEKTAKLLFLGEINHRDHQGQSFNRTGFSELISF